MNAELFKSLLRPYWQSQSINDLDDAADKIATAYHLANVGDTRPFFGATLINGDKDTLKTFLSLGLKVNFGLKIAGKDVTPGFTLMALGFCLYWASSTFLPLPPMPPMVAPTKGVTVIFPGIPIGLDKALKEAFDNTDIEQTLSALTIGLKLHLLTVTGVYSGTTIIAGVPAPLILPWVALF